MGLLFFIVSLKKTVLCFVLRESLFIAHITTAMSVTLHARFIIVKMVPDDSSFIVILSLGLNQHIRYRNGVNAKQWILEEKHKTLW